MNWTDIYEKEHGRVTHLGKYDRQRDQTNDRPTNLPTNPTDRLKGSSGTYTFIEEWKRLGKGNL